MWDFQFPHIACDFEISYTVPSLCAEALRSGQADIGIIPAVTYAEIPDLAIIPDVAIASRGPVRSILLISKVPIENIRSVATDTSSRTSVVLCQLLLQKFLGIAPQFTPMSPDATTMLAAHDAALLIGDAALLAEHSAPYVYDLAEMWLHSTRKPFVFAFWAVRKQALADLRPGLDLARVFQQSRDHGLEPGAMNQLCDDWSVKLGMSRDDVRSYLTKNIYYRLDPDCIEGLRLFFSLASENNLVPSPPPLEFTAEPVRSTIVS
jgi:chorismate dehydratase